MNVKKWLIFCLFFVTSLFAGAPKDLFSKFPNRYFVETGTYHGNGVRLALNANFHEIRTIEIDRDLFNKAK